MKILTLAGLGVPEGLDWLDGAGVVHAARKEVRRGLGGFPGRHV